MSFNRSYSVLLGISNTLAAILLPWRFWRTADKAISWPSGVLSSFWKIKTNFCLMKICCQKHSLTQHYFHLRKPQSCNSDNILSKSVLMLSDSFITAQEKKRIITDLSGVRKKTLARLCFSAKIQVYCLYIKYSSHLLSFKQLPNLIKSKYIHLLKLTTMLANQKS